LALLLWLATAVVYLPPLQDVFSTAPVGGAALLPVVPMPFIVLGADEARRWVVRRRLAARSEDQCP
jgi:hypothetical protein